MGISLTPSDYLESLLKHPEPWMLRVKMKSVELTLELTEEVSKLDDRKMDTKKHRTRNESVGLREVT